MLTHIVHNSPQVCAFYDQLHLNLSKPQRQHLLNLMDALLVCEDEKTLAALQRQFITAPDASNLADFLRISPWQVRDVRKAIRTSQVQWALARAEQLNLPKVLFINLDDSLGEKERDTRHLEPVDWFHDHSESTKTKPVFKNAFCYLEATLRIGTRWSASIYACTYVPKPCGGSIVTGQPDSAFSFAPRTAWRA